MPKEKPKATAKKLPVPPKKKNKSRAGRPKIVFSQEIKDAAIQYVRDSGYWKVRLAKFLKVNTDTLDKKLKQDKNFSEDLEAAEAEFLRKTIKNAKPEFVLKTKYKDEFPEHNPFDPGAGSGGDELEAVILHIRKILPASK